MVGRLDEEKLEILRGWGSGLASDDREELRAAGKAIMVLIDEIDRLQVDLWNMRVEHQAASAQSSQGLAETLAERIAARRSPPKPDRGHSTP